MEYYRSKYQGNRRFTVEEVWQGDGRQIILYRTDDRARAEKYRKDKALFSRYYTTVIVDQITKEVF